eukprot:gene7041-8187_t
MHSYFDNPNQQFGLGSEVATTDTPGPPVDSPRTSTAAGMSQQEAYVLLGQVKGEQRLPSPSSQQSKITWNRENPLQENLNQTLLQTINCKLQLIPPELDHFTLNLDNHFVSEKLLIAIMAAVISNNENYHNRHLATTYREMPVTTVRRKRIAAEFHEYIGAYYFNLTKLSLKKTFLSLRSLEALAQALRGNRSILELDLGGNELNSSGIAVLISGMRYNQSITRLNLSDVRAYDEGAFMIAAFLMSTKSLKTIDLSTNHISDKGLEALKQSALRNTSITSLYLEDNNIDPAKLYSLSNILKRNGCIQYVFETIFDKMSLNRKFKNKLQSFKKGVMQVRSNSTLNISVEEERKPLFRLMKQNSNVIAPPEQLPSNRFIIGKSETIGKRPTMEDRMVAYGCYRESQDCELYCIFDGHGGKSASDYAADNIYRIFGEYLDSKQSPQEAFKFSYQQIHTQISPWPFMGTTAVVCVSNVGDSRVVLGRLNDQNRFEAERLTFDHRPVEESERLRITNAGGTVLNGRVNGMLAVSRALGDSFLTPYVTPDPYLSSFTIKDSDKFLILACDGVWDLISDEEAVRLVSSIPDPSKSSEELRDLAFAQGSTDNISVMIVKLNEY